MRGVRSYSAMVSERAPGFCGNSGDGERRRDTSRRRSVFFFFLGKKKEKGFDIVGLACRFSFCSSNLCFLLKRGGPSPIYQDSSAPKPFLLRLMFTYM